MFGICDIYKHVYIGFYWKEEKGRMNGYLMDGLVRLGESPMDAVKNFPLQFKESKVSVKEVNKAL